MSTLNRDMGSVAMIVTLLMTTYEPPSSSSLAVTDRGNSVQKRESATPAEYIHPKC